MLRYIGYVVLYLATAIAPPFLMSFRIEIYHCGIRIWRRRRH